jgi:hypothetical protein
MEDEEYYHVMLNDLERLERVHHHVDHRDSKIRRERLRNPFISGIRFALNGAISSGLARLRLGAAWHDGQRMSSGTVIGA